jgi:hypothetical protein
MYRLRAASLAALLSIPLLPAVAAPDVFALALNDVSQVRPHNVTVAAVSYRGSDALEVRLTGPYRGPDMDTFAFVPGLDFHDGTIEVDVAGSPLAGAPSGARGFVGVAFRIDADGGSYSCEGIYIRPTNGRAEDQVRRNHSTQYFSYPGYGFDRLPAQIPAGGIPAPGSHLGCLTAKRLFGQGCVIRGLGSHRFCRTVIRSHVTFPFWPRQHSVRRQMLVTLKRKSPSAAAFVGTA